MERHTERHTERQDRDSDTTSIPYNFFDTANRGVFATKMEENTSLEQFFWTEETVQQICRAIEYETGLCCLMTPSVAHYIYDTEGREERLLDIDRRFAYLPGFRYYDVTIPHELPDPTGSFRLLILDPPFFLIPIEKIAEAVDVITQKDYTTKILIAFIRRGEQRLREAFKHYKLFPTGFQLHYASIKENKHGNFCLYSNVDLPGIRRKL